MSRYVSWSPTHLPRSLRKCVAIDTLKVLCNGIALPSLITLTSCMTLHIQLQKLQIGCAMLISSSGPCCNTDHVIHELSWLSVQHEMHLLTCGMVLKCRNGHAPDYLVNIFTSNNNINPAYNTGNAYQLWSIKAKTAYYYHGVRYPTIKWIATKRTNFTTLLSIKKSFYNRVLSLYPSF